MVTSLLSKRWRSLWKMMPTLNFDQKYLYGFFFKFDQFCMRVLKLHEAPILKTLNIKLINDKLDDIDILIFPSISSTVFEIAINVTYTPSYNYCRLSNSSISFSNNLRVFQTLVVLKLQGYIYLNIINSPVCFLSLKSLYLEYVNFSTPESFSALLLACSVLEDLFLQSIYYDHKSQFSILVPSLRRLSIIVEEKMYAYVEMRLKIITPSLSYVKILGPTAVVNFEASMPNLVEAHLSIMNYVRTMVRLFKS